MVRMLGEEEFNILRKYKFKMQDIDNVPCKSKEEEKTLKLILQRSKVGFQYCPWVKYCVRVCEKQYIAFTLEDLVPDFVRPYLQTPVGDYIPLMSKEIFALCVLFEEDCTQKEELKRYEPKH